MSVRKPTWRSFLGALLALAAGLALGAPEGALDERHKQFLKDADLLLTTAERELLSRLTTPQARDLFVELFWKARDPTPGTERNEFREEHFRRLRYARRRLADDTPRDGALTDRGRMYILLGEPIRIERYPGQRGLYPMELWFYSGAGNTRLPPYFYLLFYRPFETGEHKLYVPGPQNPGDLIAGSAELRTEPDKAFKFLRGVDVELAYASVSLDATKKSGRYDPHNTTTFSQGVVAAIERIPADTTDTSYVRRFRPDGSIETDHTFTYIEMDFLSRTYVHEQGETHLHYAVQLLPRDLGVGQHGQRTYASLLLAGSVTPEGKPSETLANLEDNVEIQLDEKQLQTVMGRPFAVLGRQFLLPGRHELHLVLKNNTSRQYGRAEAVLQAPEPGAEAPWLSPPLLVSGAEREPKRQDGLEKPFQVGKLRLVPKVRREVHPEESVQIYSQLLPGRRREEAASWRARLELVRDGQTSRSLERPLAELDSGPSGSMHVLLEVPTQALALGPYELRLSVLDAAGGQAAAGSETMRLGADAAPPPWQSAKRRPGPGSEPVQLEAARQLLRQGRPKETYAMLGPAGSRLLLTSGPLQGTAWQSCVTLAEAAQKLGKLDEAASYLERALSGVPPTAELLAELGRIRLALGDRARAREAWQRSLELEPDQPELEEQLKALRP
jgi:GWxTD domain-containing protein